MKKRIFAMGVLAAVALGVLALMSPTTSAGDFPSDKGKKKGCIHFEPEADPCGPCWRVSKVTCRTIVCVPIPGCGHGGGEPEEPEDLTRG